MTEKSILVVEDEREIASGYCSALREVSMKVLTASSGQDALLKIRNQTFHLLVCDLKMPKLSGDRLIHILRSDPLYIQTPIIMASAFIDSAVVSSFGHDKRLRFLVKPVRGSQLVKVALEMLDRPAPTEAAQPLKS